MRLNFLNKRLIPKHIAAGRIKENNAIKSRVIKGEVPAAVISEYVAIGPTKPAVPIPEPTGEEITPNITPTGPKIALVITGGSQQTGCLTRFGI